MLTVSIPSDLHARSTRSAISPRLAMSTLLNISPLAPARGIHAPRHCGAAAQEPRVPALVPLGDPDVVQRLAVLDDLAVRGEDFHDLALPLGLDLVHDLHGLDDAEDGVFLDLVAHLDEVGRVGAGRAVEGPDHGRLDLLHPGRES